MSLPGLPIGKSDAFNRGDRAACVEVSYLGGDEHPIPDGAHITVSEVDFSSDILAVGGRRCGGRPCRGGEVAFRAKAGGCVVPVQITRDHPIPSDKRDADGAVVVTMTMDGAVHCPSAQRQRCDDFVRDLRSDLREGILDPTFTITILGFEPSSEPAPTSASSPGTESTTPNTPSPEETTTDPGTPGDTATSTPGTPSG